MKHFLTILFLVFLVANKLSAQDLVFSQPYAIAQNLNPAMVGTGIYPQRVQAALRTQFVSGTNLYSTIAASWDSRIANKKSNINNYMGIGVQVLSDRLMSGIVQNNYISLNLAYHIYLDNNLYQNFAFALGGTFAQTNFDRSKLIFGDQYNSAGGLINASSMENLIAAPSTGVVNTGILYSYHNERTYVQGGISANFTNKPHFTYNYLNETNGMRLLGMLHAETSIFYNNTILFQGQYQHKEGHTYYSTGMAFSFPITNDWEHTKRLYLGCATRNLEVLMPNVSILTDGYGFGLTYDFNFTNANGALLKQNIMEISFTKSFGKKKGPLFRTLFD